MNIQQMVTRFSLCLLAWWTLAVAPTCGQTITHVPLFTFDGDSFFDQFGSSVSGAGDVNGDGFADLIVGAPNVNRNNTFAGSARVFSGVDGSILYTFDGDSIDASFGVSVSGAGDVNGDGFDDVIVGADQDDNNGVLSGSAQVFSGVDGSVLYTFDGDSPVDSFGGSVSSAGDVNGDGFSDLIVGSWSAENNGLNSGFARMYSGVDGSVLYTLDGDTPGERSGWSVSGAGDVNGDGVDDLIAGANDGDINGPFSGSARVYSGVDGSVLLNLDSESTANLFDISVSGAGDVNGDGVADLIVGEPRDVNSRGSARVFSGSDGSLLYTLVGNTNNEQFGTSVSDLGDVNGDGFADLIVGEPFDRDNGAIRGIVRVFSGADGSVLFTFVGDSLFDQFGCSVSSAGDVNGDGAPDFIVGASSGGANDGGYAKVFVSQITVPFVLGDVNQDGVVNFLDINPFIEFLGFNTFLLQADCNQDGAVNFLDIAFFIAILAAQ